jgi:hypothetical protein
MAGAQASAALEGLASYRRPTSYITTYLHHQWNDLINAIALGVNDISFSIDLPGLFVEDKNTYQEYQILLLRTLLEFSMQESLALSSIVGLFL